MIPTSHKRHPKAPVVSQEYGGQWIAWNHQYTRIVASGRTFAEARSTAAAAGEPEAILEKVPRSDRLFVGFQG